MSAGLAAMLAGVLGVPLALLWAGHRLRRRTARRHAMFWGALAGHLLAMPVAIVAGLIPPAEWSAGDVVRGALGFWLMLVAPIAGAAIGALMSRGDRQ